MSGHQSRATILVVEDDLAIAHILTDLLHEAGYLVLHATSGGQARRMLDDTRPDLIILDLVLPDVDGLVFCQMLKSTVNVPIIVCSATSRRRDAVLALKLGADDFIAKPFDVFDLEGRIEAVLRRARPTPAAARGGPANRLQVGSLTILPDQLAVMVDDHPISVTPIQYRLLLALASRANEVVTREELARLVYGYPDVASGRTIDVHMRRLRLRLLSGPVPPPSIVSVRGFGYKLVEDPAVSQAG